MIRPFLKESCWGLAIALSVVSANRQRAFVGRHQCAGEAVAPGIADAPSKRVAIEATTITTTTNESSAVYMEAISTTMALKMCGDSYGPIFSPSGHCRFCHEASECRWAVPGVDTLTSVAGQAIAKTATTKCSSAVCPADTCPDGSSRRQVGETCCACPSQILGTVLWAVFLTFWTLSNVNVPTGLGMSECWVWC